MSTCNNLPPEIIEAILRLLPAKSLGRFKCVSKPWLSLISNPQFIKSHLLNNHHNKNLILISDSNSLYSVDINELPPYLYTDNISATGKELSFRQSEIMWIEILGSCNGVVLAREEDDQIYLINPTTREVFEIPISPFAIPIGESYVMYGFGYDSSTDDYKVVSIAFWDTDNEHNPDSTDMFVSVYSLRSNSWRKLENSRYDHAVGYLISGVLVNENLHWLTSRRPEYSTTIVAFSLANEEFKEIELPDSVDDSSAVFNELCVLDGKLVVFGNHAGNDLWVMEEYGVAKSWTTVNVHGVEIDPVRPVCLIEGSDGDLVLGEEDRVIVYNKDEKRCKDVGIIGVPSEFAIGGIYVETIESLKRINGKL